MRTLSAHQLLPYSGYIFRLIEGTKAREAAGFLVFSQPHLSDSVDAVAQGMYDWMPTVDDVGRIKWEKGDPYRFEFEIVESQVSEFVVLCILETMFSSNS